MVFILFGWTKKKVAKHCYSYESYPIDSHTGSFRYERIEKELRKEEEQLPQPLNAKAAGVAKRSKKEDKGNKKRQKEKKKHKKKVSYWILSLMLLILYMFYQDFIPYFLVIIKLFHLLPCWKNDICLSLNYFRLCRTVLSVYLYTLIVIIIFWMQTRKNECTVFDKALIF